MRSQMANRQQVITIAYRTTVRSNSEDPKVSIVKSIVAKALEETGNENEGDYLRWQYGRYVCNIQGESVVNATEPVRIPINLSIRLSIIQQRSRSGS